MFTNHFTNAKVEKLDHGKPTEGVFFTPNGHKGRRLKENLTHVNAVFADWDFKPAEGEPTGSAKPDYKQFMLDLDGLPEPTFVVESGNGWHLYWCLDEAIEVNDENRDEVIAQVEGVHRFIHEHYNSDSGAGDVLRLMRLPGHEHKKQPEYPFMVEVIEESDSTYTWDEILEAMPPVYKEVAEYEETDSEDYDIRQVAIDVWAEKGDEVSFDTIGRMIWNGQKTGTFIGRKGGNYIATTSDEFPYKGNPTTYVAGVLGVSTKEAYKWLIAQYGELEKPVAGVCQEREDYLEHKADANFGDDDWKKELQRLEKMYIANFHKYVAIKYPYLLFESGEDKSYWNYDADEGVYKGMNFSTVRGLVAHLIIEEGFEVRLNETLVKNILLKYRAIYVERGVTLDSFMTPDNMFPMKNGWFNLDTQELVPHSPERKTLFKSAIAYDKSATCPLWDKFLDEDLQMAKDQVRVIDQFSGYLLTPRIDQHKCLFFDGRTGAGKSTIPLIWRKILGDLSTQASLTSLEGGEVRFMGDVFTHRHFCFFDEANPRTKHINEYFQNLISNETIKVERKGIQEKPQVRNMLKIVVALNEMPDHMPPGMKRRYTHIKFNRSFTEEGTADPRFAEKVIEGELSGVFNRMVRGLKDFEKMGGFTMIEGEEDRRREYDLTSDDFSAFLADNFEPVADGTIRYTGQELLDAFQAQYPKGYNKQLTVRGFNKKLLATRLPEFKNIEYDKSNGKRGYKGLRLQRDKYFYQKKNEYGEGATTVIMDSIDRKQEDW